MKGIFEFEGCRAVRQEVCSGVKHVQRREGAAGLGCMKLLH